MNVEQKTTFISKGNILINRKGKLFYEFYSEEPYLFNLPAGEYELVEGEISETETELEFFVQLPPKERKGDLPSKVNVVFKPTPFKAHIYRNRNEITIDPSYLKKPVYIRKFLYFHELGHYWYETEKYCDLFAAKVMLEIGFNPSQIYDAIDSVLTVSKDELQERIDYINSKIKVDEISKFYSK